MRFSMRPQRVYDGYEQIRGEELARRGIRLLLCDLDYTLAPKSQREPDETVRQWIGSLRRAGVEVMILSNNRSPARVERFCRDLGITYEGHAQKPSAKGFRRAMARVGVTPEETAMLGDKLLTDMLGAHIAGVLPLMVEPRANAPCTHGATGACAATARRGPSGSSHASLRALSSPASRYTSACIRVLAPAHTISCPAGA